MKFGKIKDGIFHAYWVQTGEIRAGVFVWPPRSWTAFEFTKIGYFETIGWMACFGPFQVARYYGATE